MALRKKQGTVLRLIFQTRVGFTSIVHQEQRGTLWCWAACVSMVLQGLDSPISQCALASMVLPKICPKCAEPCTDEEKVYQYCNVAYPIKCIEALWKQFKIQAAPPQGPIDSKAVLDELTAGHALQVLLGQSDDGGHLVLIIDVKRDSDGSLKILVADPSSDVDEASPKNLQDALGNLGWGEWRLTWTGLHF